jgi:hypothetical protein
MLFLCWLGICVAYGGSRGADRKRCLTLPVTLPVAPRHHCTRALALAGPPSLLPVGPLEGTELGFTTLPWAPLGWRQLLQTYQDVFSSCGFELCPSRFY